MAKKKVVPSPFEAHKDLIDKLARGNHQPAHECKALLGCPESFTRNELMTIVRSNLALAARIDEMVFRDQTFWAVVVAGVWLLPHAN